MRFSRKSITWSALPFYKAAIMLNDKLETVIANYAHLLEEDVAVEAYRLVEERLSQGT
jgi:hypothetical protein